MMRIEEDQLLERFPSECKTQKCQFRLSYQSYYQPRPHTYYRKRYFSFPYLILDFFKTFMTKYISLRFKTLCNGSAPEIKP